MTFFEKTVSALCYSLSAGFSDSPLDWQTAPYNDIVRFVLRQYARMDPWLRAGIYGGTFLFGGAAIVFGAPFFKLLPEKRARWIQLCEKSPMKDLLQFYKSLVVLAFFERCPV